MKNKNKNRIRIYIGNKKIVELIESVSKGSMVNKAGVSEFINYIRKQEAQTGKYQLKATSLKELKKTFFSTYKVLEAAGGVVVNNNNEVLLIYRRGFWDLPKGKTEKGETIEETAVREVEEETGLNNVEIIEPIQLKQCGANVTYHTYVQNEKQIMKPSYWYIMNTSSQKLIPQTEEDIEQAIWVPISELKNYYKKAYPAIVDVLKAALLQLKK